VTADLVAAGLAGEPLPEWAAPYAPDRFVPSTSHPAPA
jgi:hypothetical protein